MEPVERLRASILAGLMERPIPIQPETIERLRQAMRLLGALLTFATPAGPELSRESLEVGRDVVARLQSPEIAQKIFEIAGEHQRGRPVTRRHVAAAALEAKQQNSSLTRLELAQKFCPCGKARHNAECAERLRRDMQRLNALIRRILRDYPA
jgi:hypothetical protein